MKRICLWSGPRNVSTALMYSFAERDDTRVVDEPFYAYYLQETGVEHPGREEVLKAQSSDPGEVIREVIFGDYGKPVLFIKNMAHHLLEMDFGFASDLKNLFLTRDPEEMLPSLLKKISDPSIRDTAYRDQFELFNKLRDGGEAPPVLDSRELLLDPEGVLSRLCEKLEISFDPGMLTWEAGPLPEDGVWAKYWYHNVHRSTGFKPYEPKNNKVPEEHAGLLEECRDYYRELYRHAIKANR